MSNQNIISSDEWSTMAWETRVEYDILRFKELQVATVRNPHDAYKADVAYIRNIGFGGGKR